MRLNEIMRLTHSDAFKGTREDIMSQLKNSGLTFERMSGESKKLPGDNALRYFTDINKRFISIAILDEQSVIGLLELEPIDIAGSDAMLWSVVAVAVDENKRGQKIGLGLYGIALSILKLTLASGDTQTKDGERMWRNIASVPGCKVMGLVSKRGFCAALNIPDESIEEEMKKIGASYFKTRSYIQFPVEIRNGELNNEYIDVYDDDHATIYLIAHWGN